MYAIHVGWRVWGSWLREGKGGWVYHNLSTILWQRPTIYRSAFVRARDFRLVYYPIKCFSGCVCL